MKKFKTIRLIIIYLILVYASTTTTIQRFKCDKMTETELLKNLKNSLLFDFKQCK